MKVHWFGPRWDAYICDTGRRVGVPAGESCARCPDPIEYGDRGVITAAVGDLGGITFKQHVLKEGKSGAKRNHFAELDAVAYHIDCFQKSILGQATVERHP